MVGIIAWLAAECPLIVIKLQSGCKLQGIEDAWTDDSFYRSQMYTSSLQ